MHNRRTYILVAMMCLVSCKNDDVNIRKLLIGTWDVYASEMNNKSNGFMKDAWFTFSADNSVTSNLFSGNKSNKYNVENGRLTIDSQDKLDLKVVKIENDTMHLAGKVKIHFMEYYLSRRTD